MPVRQIDPTDEIRDRGREIQARDVYADPDAQERAEREQAARAYLGENEKHFVDFYQDCVKTSTAAMEDVRRAQEQCWEAYNEREPRSYAFKEPWQSRPIVPKPFQTVQFGAAAVQKAFTPNFLSVDRTRSKEHAAFWRKLLDHQLGIAAAKFIQRFSDAALMGFAVGQSMEMVPRWIPGRGLEFSLVEPWKIQRDPDAMSRKCQSGLYWVHQEWLDYFVLLDGQKKGRYFDVARVKSVSEDSSDPFLSKEAIAQRKQMLWERSAFRTMVLTGEFYGTVLDPRGEVLLPRGMFTVAGGRVIQAPATPTYRRLRWPGVSFSPLPHLLRFGGRGLLEGVLSMWDAMNEIMCLHMDALKWLVNPPEEINVDALVDPADTASYPGHKYLVRDTANGQQAVRTVMRPSRTNDVLANLAYFDQSYQRGAFVTDAVQGLPGYRKDMTYREAAMNLDQAMGVFGLMGQALEEGAVDAIEASVDVIEAYIGWQDLLDSGFTEEELRNLGLAPNPQDPRGLSGLPDFDGKCHVSGMQALMKDAETLKALREVVLPLAENGRFARYVKPYGVIKAFECRVNLLDEGVFVSEEEARLIDMQESFAAAEESEAAKALVRMQQVLGITALVERLQKIEANDIAQAAQEVKLMEAMIKDGTGSDGIAGIAAAQRDGAARG